MILGPASPGCAGTDDVGGLIDDLRTDLGAAAFTVDRLAELWGEEASAALGRGQPLLAERALAEHRGEAAATLAAVFVLGRTVGVEAFADALPCLGVTGAVALGLIRLDADRVHPVLDLRPYSFSDALGTGAWWIASDLGELALGHAIPESHVLGVGGASITLRALVIPAPVERALDLGTGCGIQALHIARHASKVVATDISERALAFASFNCALNGAQNIEFRLGSLFEPVVGERFDLIVSNPPFVITPRVPQVPAYEYRDGGMVGDALVASVVAAAGEHLNEGGVAQLLGNWEYHGVDDGLARVEGWLDHAPAGHGLDAWVIEREIQDAASYAETWIRDGGIRPGTTEFDALYAAWLDDFSTRSVRSVGFGYLTLRRRAAGSATLRRFEHVESSGSNPGGLGEQIALALDAHDRLAGASDEDFAAERLIVAGDVTEERHYWPGAEDPTVIVLHQGSGFGRTASADTALAAFVGACDGELTVGVICTALADLLDADEPALRAELIGSARELLVEGFLRFVDDPRS